MPFEDDGQCAVADERQRCRDVLVAVGQALQQDPVFDTTQIESPEPLPDVEESSSSVVDELSDDCSSPADDEGRRKSSPSGPLDGDAAPHEPQSSSAHMPYCGNWSTATNALSSNVGRVLAFVDQLLLAIGTRRSQQVQLQLLGWLADDFLPLLLGFAAGSLRLQDGDNAAVRKLINQHKDARIKLLNLNPPADARGLGQALVDMLTFVTVSEYLKRAGKRLKSAAYTFEVCFCLCFCMHACIRRSVMAGLIGRFTYLLAIHVSPISHLSCCCSKQSLGTTCLPHAWSLACCACWNTAGNACQTNLCGPYICTDPRDRLPCSTGLGEPPDNMVLDGAAAAVACIPGRVPAGQA